MKKSGKAAEWLAVGLFLSLGTAASAHAQGGGSVNGPDLKGTMIPVYSDGEIPTEKLNQALTTCYKRMGEHVLGTILGRTVQLGKSYFENIDAAKAVVNSEIIPKNESAIGFTYGTDDSNSPSIKIQNTDSILMKPRLNQTYRYNFTIYSYIPYRWECNSDLKVYCTQTLQFYYEFRSYNDQDNRRITLESQDFPFLSYQLKDKSTYGELGELVDKKFFASNIHLNYKPGTTGTVFALKAVREADQVKVDSPIKVDSADLLQCIQSNLVP